MMNIYFAIFWIIVGFVGCLNLIDSSLQNATENLINSKVEIQFEKYKNTHLRRELVRYHVRCD